MYISENYHLIMRIEASYGDRDLTFMQEYVCCVMKSLIGYCENSPIIAQCAHIVHLLCICY